MMSLAKAVPKGIKDKESKRFTLQERPPVPYVLEKDPVQETVYALKSDQSVKTTIGEDVVLRNPIWHTVMPEACIMHVSTALNAIKERGTFKAYKEAYEAYVEQRKAVKQGKAALALLTAPASKGKKTSKKASKKSPKKAPEKTLQKTMEGGASTDAPAPELRAEYQSDDDKAKSTAETAKNSRKATATKMFWIYANLLSLDAKYTWNKIFKEQMEADPFKDLQCVSRKGSRGLFGSHSITALFSPSHCVSEQCS
jgi:hypothetical protein